MQDIPTPDPANDDPFHPPAYRPDRVDPAPPPGAAAGRDDRGAAEIGAASGSNGEARPDLRDQPAFAGDPLEGDPLEDDPLEDDRLEWRARRRTRNRRRRKVDAAGRQQLSAQQRLLVLDTWIRSKLSAREFAGEASIPPGFAIRLHTRSNDDDNVNHSPNNGIREDVIITLDSVYHSGNPANSISVGWNNMARVVIEDD